MSGLKNREPSGKHRPIRFEKVDQPSAPSNFTLRSSKRRIVRWRRISDYLTFHEWHRFVQIYRKTVKNDRPVPSWLTSPSIASIAFVRDPPLLNFRITAPWRSDRRALSTHEFMLIGRCFLKRVRTRHLWSSRRVCYLFAQQVRV